MLAASARLKKKNPTYRLFPAHLGHNREASIGFSVKSTSICILDFMFSLMCPLRSQSSCDLCEATSLLDSQKLSRMLDYLIGCLGISVAFNVQNLTFFFKFMYYLSFKSIDSMMFLFKFTICFGHVDSLTPLLSPSFLQSLLLNRPPYIFMLCVYLCVYM